MPHNLSRTLFRSFSAICSFALCLGTLGCALFPAKTEHPLVDKNEERYFELNDRLQQQDAKIAQLIGRIEALTAAKAPAAPLKKIAPKIEVPAKGHEMITTEDGDPLATLQENTVASSKHESMHAYFEGTRLVEDGKLDMALSSFRDFLKANPDHVYADRAQFQIADAHFRNKDYGLVVVATNLLESKYPYSFKIPEALFKRALSLAGLGQAEPARTALKDLMKRFPESPAAKLAVNKLVELGGATTPSAPPLLQ